MKIFINKTIPKINHVLNAVVKAVRNTYQKRMCFNSAENYEYTYWYWLLDIHTWMHKFSKI
jgi:hypothetical protein